MKFCCLPQFVILVPITAISCVEKYAVLTCVSCMSADWCRFAYTSVTCDMHECYMGHTGYYVFRSGVLHFPCSSVRLHTQEQHCSQDHPGDV